MQFLVLGGEQKDIDYHEGLIKEKKAENFSFLGFVDQKDVINYLFAADVLVMPYGAGVTIKSGTVASDFTSPIKLFEYMASKRVIVASKINSVLEILEDGKNAILVEADDLDSLKKGLRKALNNGDNSSKLAQQAYRDVQKYGWKQRAEKMLENI